MADTGILQRFRARGAAAINASKASAVGIEKSNPSGCIACDPHHHFAATIAAAARRFAGAENDLGAR